MPAVAAVRLTIEREFNIYALPVGYEPTDERAVALGARELAQINEQVTAGLIAALEDARSEIGALKAAIRRLELSAEEDAEAERMREATLASLKGT